MAAAGVVGVAEEAAQRLRADGTASATTAARVCARGPAPGPPARRSPGHGLVPCGRLGAVAGHREACALTRAHGLDCAPEAPLRPRTLLMMPSVGIHAGRSVTGPSLPHGTSSCFSHGPGPAGPSYALRLVLLCTDRNTMECCALGVVIPAIWRAISRTHLLPEPSLRPRRSQLFAKSTYDTPHARCTRTPAALPHSPSFQPTARRTTARRRWRLPRRPGTPRRQPWRSVLSRVHSEIHEATAGGASASRRLRSVDLIKDAERGAMTFR
jgi:hypothetical protein